MKKKRYMLFKGEMYYPNCGWKDFAGFFDTIADAKIAARTDNNTEWVQIVDTEDWKIVVEK